MSTMTIERRRKLEDHIMYAYCEYMRMKENRMLEKDKNCIEFSMHSMVVTHRPYQEDTEIAITGMIPGREILSADNPFDIPCDVVVIPKRAFEILQSDNQHYRELAKQREENYNLLLKKTGFDTVGSLIYYLDDIIQCDTMLEVVSSYISERDKAAEAFEKEINVYSRALKEWKEGTDCPSPSTAKSLLDYYRVKKKKLQKKIDELRDDISGRNTVIEHYKRKIDEWQNATGCISPDAAKQYIDRLKGRINKIHDCAVDW